jgi:hypothetical protein
VESGPVLSSGLSDVWRSAPKSFVPSTGSPLDLSSGASTLGFGMIASPERSAVGTEPFSAPPTIGLVSAPVGAGRSSCGIGGLRAVPWAPIVTSRPPATSSPAAPMAVMLAIRMAR